MAAYREKINELQELLKEDNIDFKLFRKQCFRGVPDDSGLRPLCWKLLLNYLPPNRKQWKEVLRSKRELYKQFIDEMVVAPKDGRTDCPRIDVTMDDHPLSINPDSKWQTFFKDNEVLLQIDKDVRRLCPDISFFQQATDFPCQEIVGGPDSDSIRLHNRVQYTALSAGNVERRGIGMNKVSYTVRKAQEDYAVLSSGQEAHWEVVERILFIYAKLNPGQSYVQGMNEIIGPIYYLFATDADSDWREYAEADTFFCFTGLMSEIRDFFIKTLDESEMGINGLMNRLMRKLKECDPQVWNRLKNQELEPPFYSFRWLTLLLSQEFELPDILRIWDSLFADENRFEFLIYVCTAMIVLLRENLLSGDFPCNLKLLQNFPSMDVHIVLDCAVQLALSCSLSS
ncbi:TBC1 domain family member 13-like [Daphnia pulicaria]|uniref:TBC1 domain family member 13-like n=1 Tax=Daphnia pulicaria TaxID=35523 RepID=UPI001EEC66FC|nr:TBC1 domain family member 13-like [Daphnia pulicaria]